MDPVEAALQRARELRERAEALDGRTHDLVGRSDELLQKIDEHRHRARWWHGRRQQAAEPYPTEPGFRDYVDVDRMTSRSGTRPPNRSNAPE